MLEAGQLREAGEQAGSVAAVDQRVNQRGCRAAVRAVRGTVH